MRSRWHWLLLALMLGSLITCGRRRGGHSGDDDDVSADGDADVDGDSDGDVDGDSDADVDGDADADVDGDSDGDADRDGGTGRDGGPPPTDGGTVTDGGLPPPDDGGGVRDGGGVLCSDTCDWPGDGECDDGGAGSTTSLCDLGTDCTDCGPR